MRRGRILRWCNGALITAALAAIVVVALTNYRSSWWRGDDQDTSGLSDASNTARERGADTPAYRAAVGRPDNRTGESGEMSSDAGAESEAEGTPLPAAVSDRADEGAPPPILPPADSDTEVADDRVRGNGFRPRPDVIYEPRVALSAAHARDSLVGVGDRFPDAERTGLDGTQHRVSEYYGSLTVVVFWSLGQQAGVAQVDRLEREVVEPFRHAGVRVVTINVGDDPLAVSEWQARTGSSVATLLDTDGSHFAQIGRQRLPRTYLLDSRGDVLWFDLEYSRATRRDLRNALFYFLPQSLGPPEDGESRNPMRSMTHRGRNAGGPLLAARVTR